MPFSLYSSLLSPRRVVSTAVNSFSLCATTTTEVIEHAQSEPPATNRVFFRAVSSSASIQGIPLEPLLAAAEYLWPGSITSHLSGICCTSQEETTHMMMIVIVFWFSSSSSPLHCSYSYYCGHRVWSQFTNSCTFNWIEELVRRRQQRFNWIRQSEKKKKLWSYRVFMNYSWKL